mgnify:CR=1 FL=1
MKNKKIKAAVRGWILTVSMGLCLAGCQNADRAVVFDQVFSETLTDFERFGDEAIESGSGQESEKYVYLCGEVVKPGIYRFEEGARIADVLFLAGGFTDEADTVFVNLARKVTDGEKIYFPSVEETGQGRVLQNDLTDNRININTADIALLQTLPGIGFAKASDIIAYREEHGFFSDCEEIMNVPGIKEASYIKIKDLIKAE